ncbi:MAG: HEAT repeat domain-containing protein [Candidatus Latescibacter sp.]|nr:HEAT repeat domain-containing protein [Candidatus Latescibacter sp.]
MSMRKNLLYSVSITGIFLACFLFSASSAGFAAPAKSGGAQAFTSADAKKLKSGDHDAAAEILAKLSKMYQANGKESLKPAVAPLIECAWNELGIPEDQRWNLMDILKILSLTGDVSAKPLFLNVMSSVKGGGIPYVPQGFLLMGSAIVPELADSLKSTSPDARGRTALTLGKMFQLDKTGAFFSPQYRTRIKDLLAVNLKDSSVNVRIYSVSALAYFGDSSVVAPLEYLEKHDAHKDSSGNYEVRIEAGRTLKALKAKK